MECWQAGVVSLLCHSQLRFFKYVFVFLHLPRLLYKRHKFSLFCWWMCPTPHPATVSQSVGSYQPGQEWSRGWEMFCSSEWTIAVRGTFRVSVKFLDFISLSRRQFPSEIHEKEKYRKYRNKQMLRYRMLQLVCLINCKNQYYSKRAGQPRRAPDRAARQHPAHPGLFAASSYYITWIILCCCNALLPHSWVLNRIRHFLQEDQETLCIAM